MKNEDKDARKPISSGAAPGPGEHLSDGASNSSNPISTSSSNIGTTGNMARNAGTDDASSFGSVGANQVDTASLSTGSTGNTGNTGITGAAAQRVQQSQSSPYDATANSGDAFGGQKGQSSSSTILQSAQNLIGSSPGPLLAGAVVAGFLLQRLMKSSSAQTSQSSSVQTSQRPYRSYTRETLGSGYRTDSSLDSNRRYRTESPYARDTSYPSDVAASSSSFSTGNTDRLTDRVKQASENARTKLQATTADAKARLNDVGQLTRSQYYRAKDRVGTTVETQPWLIGVLGIALGTGLGAMLATTRREDNWLSSMRGKWMGKAEDSDQFSMSRDGTSTAYRGNLQAGSSAQGGAVSGSYQPEL